LGAGDRDGAKQAITRGGGDVLLLSMRRVNDLVAHCMTYEFEDVIAEVSGADRVDVRDLAALEFSRRAYKLARIASGSPEIARSIAPGPQEVRLDRDYELFFPVFNHPHELYALATIPNWRERCRLAACFLVEPALHLLPRYLLELLREFDHVFVGVRAPVAQIAHIVGRPCTYLGLGVDALTFSPYPEAQPRSIDICNIGRRSQVTHEAFMNLAQSRQVFYYYDTIMASGFDMKQRTFRVQDAREHRFLLASLLRRSRYYIANRSRINEPEYTKGFDEISGRFYEGAAAGAVMLGVAPDSDHFRQQFDWPDAVINLPFDSPDAGRIVAELDKDPERLARIRAQNVHHAALRHDWVHRFQTVMDILDIKPTPQMLTRQQRLQALAGEALAQEPQLRAG
jgi:hypothetical protein